MLTIRFIDMVRSVLLDKEDWMKNLMLDPHTGLDPPGCKIRAVQGVEAADYFITGYWVWAKVIENLATIGYDTNSMHFASYDWRLGFGNLEIRDHYFSQLKAKIEFSKLSSGGLKSVIITHSMGNMYYLMHRIQHNTNSIDQAAPCSLTFSSGLSIQKAAMVALIGRTIILNLL